MISSCGKGFADALKAARKVKKVLFMVRRQYYDDIVSGEKREEIRNPDNWQWLLGDDPPQVAVFMCGKDRIHRRWITRIYLEDPAKVLGREPSYQGKLDLCYDIGGYPKRDCVVVELGDVYSVEGIEFYAHDRFWKFYGNSTNMVYRTSTDGQNWSPPETVSTCPTELSNVIEWKGGKWHLKDDRYCPKCGTELEEDPEDSSEGYCPKCNYGWRFPRKEIDEDADSS